MLNIMPRGEARRINRIHRVMDALLLVITIACTNEIAIIILDRI